VHGTATRWRFWVNVNGLMWAAARDGQRSGQRRDKPAQW